MNCGICDPDEPFSLLWCLEQGSDEMGDCGSELELQDRRGRARELPGESGEGRTVAMASRATLTCRNGNHLFLLMREYPAG